MQSNSSGVASVALTADEALARQLKTRARSSTRPSQRRFSTRQHPFQNSPRLRSSQYPFLSIALRFMGPPLEKVFRLIGFLFDIPIDATLLFGLEQARGTAQA